MSDTTKIVLAVEAGMPDLASKALARFVALNPHMRGVQWADVLADNLMAADANLDVTEPMYKAIQSTISADPERAERMLPWVLPVTLTLYWATDEWEAPSTTEVYSYVMVLSIAAEYLP